MARLFNFFGGFSRGERKNAGKTSRKSSEKSRGLRLESLEERRVMTTTLFLDFGEGFGAGGLTMTAGQLRDTLSGPDVIGDGKPEMTASTPLRFDSLAAVVSHQQINFNGVGGVDMADFEALKNSVVSKVERHFAPFDVNVQIGRATSLADVTSAMNRNSRATNGKADAYVFVTGVARNDSGKLVGKQTGNLGLYTGADGVDLSNKRDETVVVYADNFFGRKVNDKAIPIDIALANVASHEAGHSFGLDHSHPTSSAMQRMYTDSDLMADGGGSGLDLTNVGMFTRFDLMYGDDNTDPSVKVNAWKKLVTDADIGARAGVEYVTGTGAFDRITITDLNNGQARVDVEMYDNARYTNRRDFISYNISTTGRIIVDSGFRNDEIILVGNLSSLVTVFGGDGDDSLELRNTGSALNSVVARGNQITVNGREVRFFEMEDLWLTGNGNTILNIDGTAAKIGQTIVLDAASVDGLTDAPLTYSGLSSMTINAGNFGNEIVIRDTPDINVNLFTGKGQDFTTIFKTSSSLTINGQAGADTVELDLPGSDTPIGGQLMINNAGSYTKLLVDDTERESFRAVSLQVVNGITKLGGFGADVAMVTKDLKGIDFTGGDSGYQFWVYDTPSRRSGGKEQITTSIVTGSGSEYISVVKSTGTLTVDAGTGTNEMVAYIDSVRGATDLAGTGGQNTYRFSDVSTTTRGLVYMLSAGSLYRANSSGGNKTGLITFGNPYRLQVNGGSGGNTYIVKEAPATSGGRVSLFTGDGNDRVTVERASSPLEIDLQGGNDALTFISPGNSPNYAATVIGGAGTDGIVYDDFLVTTAQQYLVTPTSLGREAAPINVQTIESIKVIGGSGNDAFGYAGTIPGGVVKLDGAAGSDTLDMSRFSKNLVIDLISQKATDVTQMSSFENAIGGAGNDQLLGTDGANLLDGRGGRDLIIGGLGVDAILGGEGEDLLLAGSTSHAAKAAARDAIMAEWTRSDASYGDRVTHLLSGGGLNGSTLLNRQTYTADPGANRLLGNVGLDLFFGSLARDTHDRSPSLGEVFVDPDQRAEQRVTIDVTAIHTVTFDINRVNYNPASPLTIDLLPGKYHLQLYPAGYEFTVTDAGTIQYDSRLEGIFTGRGTSLLKVNAPSIQIDATTQSSNWLSLDYQVQDHTKLISARLLPGNHFVMTQGGAHINFTVTSDGKVEYDPAVEGILIGRGTSSLKINGANARIDATALTSDSVRLDLMDRDGRQILDARLLPGDHFLQAAFDAKIHFQVKNDGTFDYAPEAEGMLSGRGTRLLKVNGAAINFDASTLSTANVFLDGKKFTSASQFNTRLLPGTHYLQQEGANTVYFTVTASGKIDYDPAYEGVLTGRGTTTMRAVGAPITIDARATGDASFSFNRQTYPSGTPLNTVQLPGEHLIHTSRGVFVFKITKAGLIDYDSSLDGIFMGRGTRTLKLLV